MIRGTHLAALCALVLILCMACGDGDGDEDVTDPYNNVPTTLSFTGTVCLDGSPVPGAMVVFGWAEGGCDASAWDCGVSDRVEDVTDAAGRYVLTAYAECERGVSLYDVSSGIHRAPHLTAKIPYPDAESGFVYDGRSWVAMTCREEVQVIYLGEVHETYLGDVSPADCSPL
jgi:hypothetical protein